jgi:hypothetical protein
MAELESGTMGGDPFWGCFRYFCRKVTSYLFFCQYFAAVKQRN